MKRVFPIVCLVVSLAACGSGPAPSATSEESSGSRASATAARVLGSCCPESGGEIIALMQRYESTPARERAPELAMLPYRMNSGLADREEIVVRDAESWAALWARIVRGHWPVPVVPAVDFAKEMLVVVSMGTRNSGGYLVLIDSVRVAEGSLEVFVRERSPGPACGTTAALTAPVALARLERRALPLRVVRRGVVVDCP